MSLTWFADHWCSEKDRKRQGRNAKRRKKRKVNCIWLKDLTSYFFGGGGFINEAYSIGPLLNRLLYCPLVLWVMVGDADEEGMITSWGK